MSDKEKQIKTSLLRTRNIIANKYRKLCRDNALREKDLEKRYAPITNSIGKLIETKENVSKKNKYLDDSDKSENLISFDNVDSKDEDEETLWEFDPVFDQNPSPNSNNVELDHPNHTSNAKPTARVMPKTRPFRDRELIQEHELMNRRSKRSVLNDANRSNLNQLPAKYEGAKQRIIDSIGVASKVRSKIPIPEKTRNAMLEKRTIMRSSANDLRRYKLNKCCENYDGNKKRITDSIAAASKIKSKPRDVDTIRKTERRQQRGDINDEFRVRKTMNKRQKRSVIISPEDYDAHGNFVGLASKRRKVERMEPVPMITISPEDYGIDGQSAPHLAHKRRKIEIPADELPAVRDAIVKNIRKNAVTERRNKRVTKMNKIKYGKSLEKKFIPYTENIVYEYYDDPNELCERLKLLVSSKGAGNSNHDQEINSIVEELRERHIIK